MYNMLSITAVYCVYFIDYYYLSVIKKENNNNNNAIKICHELISILIL